MKVLVVDDSKPIYSIVSEILKDLGHEPHWAEDGQVAKGILEKDKDFELVLLDWNMPNMNGLEFLQANDAEKFCPCPIMMMTTEKDPSKIETALGLGATDYIMKPFTQDIIQNKIEMMGLF